MCSSDLNAGIRVRTPPSGPPTGRFRLVDRPGPSMAGPTAAEVIAERAGLLPVPPRLGLAPQSPTRLEPAQDRPTAPAPAAPVGRPRIWFQGGSPGAFQRKPDETPLDMLQRSLELQREASRCPGGQCETVITGYDEVQISRGVSRSTAATCPTCGGLGQTTRAPGYSIDVVAPRGSSLTEPGGRYEVTARTAKRDGTAVQLNASRARVGATMGVLDYRQQAAPRTNEDLIRDASECPGGACRNVRRGDVQERAPSGATYRVQRAYCPGCNGVSGVTEEIGGTYRREQTVRGGTQERNMDRGEVPSEDKPTVRRMTREALRNAVLGPPPPRPRLEPRN